MAQLTRNFLTSGPISSDFGNISASNAYAVIFEQIGQAIVDASNKNAENSQKIIDELKALRSRLKEEARKHADTRIGQLPPDIAREFLEASRSIKQILGSRAPGNVAATVYSNQARTQAVKGGGTLGTAVLVQAIQDNSAAIKDTNYAIKDLPDLIQKTHDLTTGTFKAIHNFLNPNHPHSLMNALSKLFKGGTGETSLLSKIGSFFSHLFTGRLGYMLLGRIAGPILRMVAGFMRGGVQVLGAFAASYLISKIAERLREKLGYTPMKDWKKVLDFGDWFSISLDPKIWGDWGDKSENTGKGGGHSLLEGGTPEVGRGIVVGDQIDPVSFNIETRGIKLLEGGFNEGNTGISNKGDIVLELMKKQTELLAEILRALLGSSGGQGGFIRALQAGGTAAPGEPVLVGENGPEHVQAGGQSGTVDGPHVLQAGGSPVQVTPLPRISPHRDPRNFVSPVENPNVNPALLERYAGKGLPASIRMNNPGAISLTAKWGGYLGDLRPAVEGGRYTQFNTPEEGIQAQANILADYGTNRKQDTLNKIIWGPEGAGHPKGGWADRGQAEYVAHLSRLLDLDPNQKVNTADPNFQLAYIKAASIHESGARGLPYTEETYSRAILGTDPEGVSRKAAMLPPPGYKPALMVKPGGADEKAAQAQQEAVYAKVRAANRPEVTPPTAADARLPHQSPAQASPDRQDVRLNVRGGGATTSDMHRRIDSLQDKAREDRKQKPEKTQVPSHPEGHHRRGRTSPNRVAFTDVGPVAVSAGSGFS